MIYWSFCEQHFFIFNRQVTENNISRITSIIYVLKLSFNWTNPSFLICFWISLISWTTVKPIHVIIISSIICSSSIVLWGFSYCICIVGCIPVCSHWLDQRVLILKLVPGCVCNFFVGRIQTGHADLLPRRFVEGHGKISGWILRFVRFNWLLCLI